MRWSKEYLVSLKEFHWANRGGRFAELGDIILISEDRPRLFWKLGKVMQFIEDRDGSVRSAVIQTANGTSIRPVKDLFPMEINSPVINDEEDNLSVQELDVSRPKRQAALDAGIRIREQLS